MNKKSKYTEAQWKEIKKLPFAERYIRMLDTKERHYLKDKYTEMVYSEKRQAKKALMRTFKSPTGRQLRKERRYLKQYAENSREHLSRSV